MTKTIAQKRAQKNYVKKYVRLTILKEDHARFKELSTKYDTALANAFSEMLECYENYLDVKEKL